MTVMRQRRDDAGYSLAEMLVVIIMLTLVTGSITAVVITTLKRQNTLATRGSVLASIRNSLEQVDRDIRSANPLCYVSPTEVVAYEADDHPPQIVDYTFDSQQQTLTETRYSADVNGTLNPSIICAVPQVTGTGTITTDYHELGVKASRTVLSDVIAGSFGSYTSDELSATTLADCTATGADTSTTYATTAAAASVGAMTVTVTVHPAHLNTPLTTSDCGTYVRNLAIAEPNT